MKINQCRSCKSKNLIKVISLGKHYLSDFVKVFKKPRAYPLRLVLCKNCFLLQLDYTTPQKYLYTERYGYKSGINKTMQLELEGIVKDSMKRISNSNKNLVAIDIGANDGTLLKCYPKNVYKIGIEPIKKYAKECKKYCNKVINSFFNYDTYFRTMGNKKADIISAISCFYDMEDPNIFLRDIKKILNQEGILVIQQNYLVEMIKKNAFDNIVHEHLEYYSLLSLNNLLSRHNLEVFDVKIRDLNGGSFRTYISVSGKRRKTKAVIKMEQNEIKLGLDKKNIYSKFAKEIEDNKKNLHSFIDKENRKGKTIFLYGASTRGNTLLQYFKLNNKLIKFAVERNPEKLGKIISSVNIPIISEQEARRRKPDYMLVLPWFFKKEFISRERKYLNDGGHFIFPLPKMEII